MTDLENKYKELIANVDVARYEEEARLHTLQTSYIEIMGHEDISITKRIKEIDSKHTAKIERINEFMNRHTSLPKYTDIELKIASANERIAFEEDILYAKDTNYHERILNRSLTESEYWEGVFPEDKIEAVATTTTDDVMMPTFSRAKIVTVGDILGHPETGERRIARLNNAIQDIQNEVKNLYHLEGLTEMELIGLQENLEQFCLADSSFRVEQMSIYIEARLGAQQWNDLTPSQQATLKYSRERDRKSESGQFKTITKKREETLALMIFQMYDRMMDENHQFRLESFPEKRDFFDGKMSAVKVFCVEKYLLESVATKRAPIYQQVVSENLEKLIEFHQDMHAKSPDFTSKVLDAVYEVKTIRSLVDQFKEKGFLTSKQRRFGLSLITRYLTKLRSYQAWKQEGTLQLTEGETLH